MTTTAPSAEDISASVAHVFDQFVTAVTCKSVLATFHQLVDLTGLRHADHHHFYNALKGKLAGSWKGQALWSKLDKRAAHRDYKRGQAAKDMRVLVIGSGPCGLRTAIECAFLGAKTVVVEKRDRFSRNNVLHLWPYLITDLRNLGAKKFFGKFCAGSLDHISIRQLQCILLKVALLLGVEVHVNVAFEGLIEPPEDQSTGVGWRCNVNPSNHVLSEFIFDVLIGADGKRNTLPGFKRKEFRGKLAIAITANFINRNTTEEASVEEISGVAFIFNQKFFHELKETTRIDLENIVYYKDDTHYFVMTAKKASLLEKGVLKEDYGDTIALLDRSNVNQDKLLSYAKQAANFSTNYQLPNLDYAVNHYGQADVAMFDFTSMFAADNASRFILKNGHHLLMGLVGDSLLEPFWPTGSGCARGFLGAFDAAWMIRNWASGNMKPLQVLAERESVYTILSQTTPNYLHKNYTQYSIDPNTRYPNLNRKCVKPFQVRQYYEGGDPNENDDDEDEVEVTVPVKRPRNADEIIDSYNILRWCQRVLNTGKYRDVHIVDFTSSWRSGLAFCALIHSFRPELIDMNCLLESDVAANNQLAFNIAEQELGIPPVMCGIDMAKQDGPDKLTMVAYLAQFYQLFRQDVLPSTVHVEVPVVMRNKRKSLSKDSSLKSPRSPNRRISFLQRLSSRLAKSKKRKEQEVNEASPLSSKKMKEKQEAHGDFGNKLPMDEIANRLQVNQGGLNAKPTGCRPGEDMTGAISVTAMAEVLRAKFKSLADQPAPEPIRRMKGQPALQAASSASEFCSFCHKRVYIMERMSAEGEFFHRGCFKCDHCYVGLRLNNYSCEKDAKPVKFYCYRHALPEMRVRRRKRGLEDEAKENVPHTVIHPPDEDEEGDILVCKEKSPKKGAGLSPIKLPGDVADMPSKTPERVEFEISFDGQEEESEEEQFEHNLRASMSSDTLLDQDDEFSDSSDDLDDDDDQISNPMTRDYDYISESEMAWILDEWSGAEDDVWESAGEVPGSPLTSEELIELVGTLRSRHQSREDTLGQRKYQRLDEAEDRDGDDDDDDDDDEDEYADEDEDDESMTEVEEGESEYETDSSEEDSIVKNAPKIIRQTPATYEDRKLIKTAAVTTPTSPSTRLSASKASFFSEPPKVVSLDPWSMFGMGNKKGKAAKAAENEATNDRQVDNNGVLSDDDKTISVSESTRKGLSENGGPIDDGLGRDNNTDVSESLEVEGVSGRVGGREKTRSLSEAGSIDELDEELEADYDGDEEVKEDEEEEKEEEVKNVEVKKRGILSKCQSYDIEEEEEEEDDVEKGAEDGDDEEEKEVGDEDEDEMLEKTAVTHAMEQLLKDIDHKGKEGKGFHLDNHHNNFDTSSSGENDSFIEGRLSPSALKTRKFRMRRHAVRQKNAKRQTRSGRLSLTSESEAGRTDPTTTDNSMPKSSSVSRSPSVELEKLSTLPVLDTADEVKEETGEAMEPSPDKEEIECKEKELVLGNGHTRDDVEIEKDIVNKNLDTKMDLEDIDTTGGSTTGNDTLRQVLESIAAMPDLSQESDVDIDDLVFTNLDDRFVTRRKKTGKRPTLKLKKIGSSKTDKTEGDPDSTFSISTPSDSESSVSSVEGHGLSTTNDRNEEEEEEGPDEEMLKDYQTTISLALEESFSDGETEADVKDVKVDVETVDKVESKTGEKLMDKDVADKYIIEDVQKAAEDGTGSVYCTPEIGTDKDIEPFSSLRQKSTTSPVNSKSPPSLDSMNNSKNTPLDAVTPTNDARLINTRESTGSDVFVSPVESFSSPPPLAKSETPPDLYKTPASSFTPQLLKQTGSSRPVLLDQDKVRNSLDLSSKHSSTNSLSSSSSSQLSSNQKESVLNSETISSNLSTTKTPRKLPELPKLKVPSRQTVRGGNIKLEAPVSCSSPKLSTRLSKINGSDNKSIGSPKLGRPLPVPNTLSSSSSTTVSLALSSSSSSIPSSSKSAISSISTPLSTPTSTVRPISSLSTSVSVRSTLPSSLPLSTAVSSTSSSLSQPSRSTPTSSKPIPSSFGAKLSSQPISPPIFRPPSKTVIPLNKKKIVVGGSSADTADSDQDVGRKKRISAEGISVESNGIEDIPFADESSEFEDKFFTPHSTMKQQQKPLFPVSSRNEPAKSNVRKRILPSPPSSKPDPTVLSADQIRDIRKADIEKAKVQARERARLKSDEELGIAMGNSIPDTPTKAQNRAKTKIQNEIRRESASYDTQSASDNNILSDSDDKLSSLVTSPASSASEQNATSVNGKYEKKKKVKAVKPRKAKKDKKETDSEKKEKRKSLLALILPGKSSPDKSHNKENHANSTDKDSDNGSTPKLSKTKLPKSNKGDKDKKSKRPHGNIRSKSNSRESLDKTPVMEGKKDLAICSVFHSEAANKANLTPTNPLRRTLPPLAPKASIDEFSDSDESHISQFTVRKMEDNLDERVSRRLRKIQQKQQRQAQQKRLRMAQEIQRQLEEVEVRQRELEERGTAVEKILRGDGPEDIDFDEGKLMNEWFSLVHEKNALLRYESELNVRAKELELEDRQARLESDFRERSRKAETLKTDSDIRVEGQLLDELLDVVEQRNTLVAMLEEDRLREKKEDEELHDMMRHKGYLLSPMSYDTRRERQNISAPLASPAL